MERTERQYVWIAFAGAVGMLFWGVATAVWNARGGPTPAPIWTMLAVVAATIVAMLIVIRFATRYEKKVVNTRSAGFKAFADASGYRYVETGDDAFRASVLSLPGLTKKSTTMYRIEGEIGDRPFTAFETYRIHRSPEAMFPIYHTVYTLDAPAHWSEIKIAPRCWWGRLMYRLGVRRGIDVGSPSFNVRFRVQSEDEAFALAMLSSELQAFILEKRNVVWKVEPGRIALVYSGTMKQDRIPASLARLERFWTLVDDELKAG